jgi:hypothetical protein
MSENELVLRIPHSLGAAEAKRRIANGEAAAQAQYGQYLRGLEMQWEGNRLSFRLTALAQSIRGTIDVENTYVELRAKLPFLIRLLSKHFVPVVQDTGRKLLGNKL